MISAGSTDDLEAAWAAVPEATPPGWLVGRPSFHDERNEWSQCAFDPAERALVGVRQREWTAIGTSEVERLLETARCLREIREGRAPR